MVYSRVSLFHLFPARMLRNSFQKRCLPFISIYSMWLKAFIHPIYNLYLIHVLLNIAAAPTTYTFIYAHTRGTLTTTQIRRRLNLEYFDGP